MIVPTEYIEIGVCFFYGFVFGRLFRKKPKVVEEKKCCGYNTPPTPETPQTYFREGKHIACHAKANDLCDDGRCTLHCKQFCKCEYVVTK